MRSRFLTSLILLSSLFPIAAHAATATSSLEVSGWIPYWRTAAGTADALAHLNAFTEINPFGYTVKKDASLNDTLNINAEPWLSLIKAAKAKKIRVIPTVTWGDQATIHAILSNTASRIKLEDAIANTVMKNGFDGIDIDFENKMPEDKNYFSTFLKGLYTRMGSKWVMCDIEPRMPLADRYPDPSTAPPDATDYANDYVQINKYCDRVRLMTYDQGATDILLDVAAGAPYAPVADPVWVARIVNLAAQDIARNKIEIGIATYGYEYVVTPLSGGYRYDLRWALNPGYALTLASELKFPIQRNSAGEPSFLYMPTSTAPVAAFTGNNSSDPVTRIPATSYSPTTSNSPTAIQATQAAVENLVSWSDAPAIADKVALAKQLGVRGISIFKIDGGEDPVMWNVLPAPFIRR